MSGNSITRISACLTTALVVVAITLSSCQRYESSAVQRFRIESNRVLSAMVRDVAAARAGYLPNPKSQRARGTHNHQTPVPLPVPVPAPQPRIQIPLLPDTAAEVNGCLAMVGRVKRTRENYAYALSMVTACLDRLLARTSSFLYAFAFQHLGPQGQQMFQFLLDPNAQGFNPNQFAYNTPRDPLGLGNVFQLPGVNGPLPGAGPQPGLGAPGFGQPAPGFGAPQPGLGVPF